MSAYLLDVNVLVALVWPKHDFHDIVEHWFSRHSREGWATCPFTEAGMIRIVCTPAFSPQAATPREALIVLADIVNHRHHEFWPDNLRLDRAIAPFRDRVTGHKQITDAYLLGLAIHKGGTLATLDRGIAALLPQPRHGRPPLEIIR